MFPIGHESLFLNRFVMRFGDEMKGNVSNADPIEIWSTIT
jgi:hypothetical protein